MYYTLFAFISFIWIRFFLFILLFNKVIIHPLTMIKCDQISFGYLCFFKKPFYCRPVIGGMMAEITRSYRQSAIPRIVATIGREPVFPGQAKPEWWRVDSLAALYLTASQHTDRYPHRQKKDAQPHPVD